MLFAGVAQQIIELVRFPGPLRLVLAGLAAALTLSVQGRLHAQQSNAEASPTLDQRQFLDRYCATCHNQRLQTGGLSLEQVDVSRPAAQPEVWEKVVRKLHTGLMPPPHMPQPSQADRRAMFTWLRTTLDAGAAANLNPGRTETLRRLTRTEYQNAVRDLLALDIDAASLLPADESGHGFDNVIVGDLSPTLLNRYISAAQKISRLAVGTTQSLQGDIIRVPPDLTQEDHLHGLPLGTRGGVSTSYTFPRDGEYEIQILLARNLTGTVSGMRDDRRHELLVLLDRKPVKTFTIQRPARGEDSLFRQVAAVDKDLKARVAVSAGPHNLAVTFAKEGSSLTESLRQPSLARFNDNRYPRTAPAIDQVLVTGPYGPKGPGNTPSRRRLFVCRPSVTGQQSGRGMRKRDSVDADAARLSAAGRRSRVRRSDGLLSPRACRRRFRNWHRQGSECCARQPEISVSRGTRPSNRIGRRHLPS